MATFNTAAVFGYAFLAKIHYQDGGSTLHGPLDTPEEAQIWIDDRLEFDDDSVDGEVLVFNKVRGGSVRV